MSFPRGFLPVIEEYREFGPTGWLSTTPLMRGDYVPVYMMGQGPPPPLHEEKESRFFQGFGGFGGVTPKTGPAAEGAFPYLKGIKIIDPTTGKMARNASSAVGNLLQQPNNWPAVETLLREIAKPGKERDPALQMSTPGGLGSWVNYSQAISNTGYLQDLKAWYDNFHAAGGVEGAMQREGAAIQAAGKELPWWMKKKGGGSGYEDFLASAPGAPGAPPSYPEEEGFPWLPVVGGVLVLGAVIGTILVVKKKKAPHAQSNPSIHDVLGL